MHFVQRNTLNFDRNFAQLTRFEEEGRALAAKGGRVAHSVFQEKKNPASTK